MRWKAGCKRVAERINRNIVECKFFLLLSLLYKCIELIETLWNVNPLGIVIYSTAILELIETLWNVNTNIICVGGESSAN